MKYFQVEVSKGLEKFTFIRQAKDENELKQMLHKEHFSILSIKEIEKASIEAMKFYFEFQDATGKIKKGSIVGSDIFKCYLQLKEKLGYTLLSLTPNPNASEEEKKKIMHDLEEQYAIFTKIEKKKIEEQKQKEEKIIQGEQKKEERVDAFFLKKELESLQKIIEKVMQKITTILQREEYASYLSHETKTTLEEIYQELLKLRTSHNKAKLQEIAQKALEKIGKLEIEILSKQKNDFYRKSLQSTNELLKDLKLRIQFVEPEKDTKRMLKEIVFSWEKGIENLFKKKPKKQTIDTNSYEYLKTRLRYERYKKLLMEHYREMLKCFWVFLIPGTKYLEKKHALLLKYEVIRNNLLFLKAKLSHKPFSLTRVKKGYQAIFEKIIKVFHFLAIPGAITFILYSMIFFSIQGGIASSIPFLYLPVSFYGLFYFIFFLLIVIALRYTAGIISFVAFLAFFSIAFIFGMVNF